MRKIRLMNTARYMNFFIKICVIKKIVFCMCVKSPKCLEKKLNVSHLTKNTFTMISGGTTANKIPRVASYTGTDNVPITPVTNSQG